MDESKFWDVIQRANDSSDGDMFKKCKAIQSAVAVLSENEATDFKHHFDQMMDRAYCWPLWAAAHIISGISGFCSDDRFWDFRTSLISRGQRAFECAIADPESLANFDDYDEESWFYEGYEYAIRDGVEAAGAHPDRLVPFPQQPSGEPWEENVYELFPRLTNRFVNTYMHRARSK